MSTAVDTKQLRVQAIRWQAQSICSFELIDPDEQALEYWHHASEIHGAHAQGSGGFV